MNEYNFPSASTDFLLDLLFDSEDGGNIFLRSIGFSSIYMRYKPQDHTVHANEYSVLMEDARYPQQPSDCVCQGLRSA
jgi:hypothetical protein